MTLDPMTCWTLSLYAFFVTGSATAGIAIVCQLMKWAPMNITLNMYGTELGDEDDHKA